MIFQKVALALVLTISFSAFSQSKYKSGSSETIMTYIENDTIFSNKTLVENLETIPQFSYAVKTLKESGVVIELESQEMFTVFVPVNSAFSSCTEEELKALFASSNTVKLNEAMSFHFIPGRIDASSLENALKRNKGTVTYKTISGNRIQFQKKGDAIFLIDSFGNSSQIMQTNLVHSKGYMHVVNGFLYSF